MLEIRREKVGDCFEQIARNILREDFNMSKTNQDEVIAHGFDHVEAYVGAANKIKAAVATLRTEAKRYGACELPSTTEELVLHGEHEDPRIVKIRNNLTLGEAAKADVAYELIVAVHQQHQREEAHAHSRKHIRHEFTPVIEKANHRRVDPLDDLRFTPPELTGRGMLIEHYRIVKPILTMFGIAPDPQGIRRVRRHHQEHLVRFNGVRTWPDLVNYIKNNQMSVVKSVDAKLRHGSAPRRLADRVIDANPDLLNMIR